MGKAYARRKAAEPAKLLPALLIIIALCGAALFLVVLPPRSIADGPRAIGGKLDLSGADLATAIHRLDGEWEFYGGALYTPSDFAGGRPIGGGFAEVPSRWKQFGGSRSGYATYRLVMKADGLGRMSLYIPLIGSSARLWVNGDEVYTAGRVGTSPDETVVSIRNGLVPLDFADGEAEIVLQYASHVPPA